MQILQATHFKLHFGTICHFFMVSLNWYPNLPCYHTSIISLRMNHISFFDSLMYSSQVHLLLNGQNPCSCAWWPSFADLRKCYWCDTVKTLHIFLFWGVFSTLISYHCIWLKLNHLYEPSNSTGLEKKECKNVDTISPGQGFGFWHFNNVSVLYSFSVFVQKWSKKKKIRWWVEVSVLWGMCAGRGESDGLHKAPAAIFHRAGVRPTTLWRGYLVYKATVERNGSWLSRSVSPLAISSVVFLSNIVKSQ